MRSFTCWPLQWADLVSSGLSSWCRADPRYYGITELSWASREHLMMTYFLQLLANVKSLVSGVRSFKFASFHFHQFSSGNEDGRTLEWWPQDAVSPPLSPQHGLRSGGWGQLRHQWICWHSGWWRILLRQWICLLWVSIWAWCTDLGRHWQVLHNYQNVFSLSARMFATASVYSVYDIN